MPSTEVQLPENAASFFGPGTLPPAPEQQSGGASPPKDSETREFEAWRSMHNYRDRYGGTLPYKNPLPKFDGNPWAATLKGLSERDTARCKAWVEEVQNLLIFAGLFSAVVTAFVIESYQGLQQDPNQVSADLLLRIAVSLEGAANGSTPATQIPLAAVGDFTPTSSAIRVNALWFLSLVFSLTTVLVGIVCAQWVREHQLPTQALSPGAVELSLHHMQSEALDRWYVPQIFSALPLLLQFGLVFFFIGLIDFLWHLNHIVAAPVLVGIGLTLIFLLATTCIPALQELTLYFPTRTPSQAVRSPCPYKSPQSWAFLQAMLPVWRTIYKIAITPIRDRFGEKPHWWGKVASNLHPLNEANFESWSALGEGWLSQRTIDSILAGDVEFNKNSENGFLQREFIPPYDCVLALSKSSTIVGWLPTYVCFAEVSSTWDQKLDVAHRKHVSDLIASSFHLHNLHRFHKWACTEVRLPRAVRADVNKLLFLPSLRSTSDDAHRLHISEICVRIAHWLMSRDRRMAMKANYMRMFWAQNVFWDILSISNSNSVSWQMTRMLLDVFKFESNFYSAEDNIGSTTHTTDMIWQFIHAATSVATIQDLRTFENGVREILRLRFPADCDWDRVATRQQPDHLFVAFSCYMYHLPPEKKDLPWIEFLRTTLEPYSHHVKRRTGVKRGYLRKLCKAMDIQNELEEIWSFPGAYFERSVDDSEFWGARLRIGGDEDLRGGESRAIEHPPSSNVTPTSNWKTNLMKTFGRLRQQEIRHKENEDLAVKTSQAHDPHGPKEHPSNEGGHVLEVPAGIADDSGEHRLEEVVVGESRRELT